MQLKLPWVHFLKEKKSPKTWKSCFLLFFFKHLVRNIFLGKNWWQFFWEKIIKYANTIEVLSRGLIKKIIWFVRYSAFSYPAPLIFENINMLRMSVKLHKTENFNIESMKNYNLLIKWGPINILRTIYIWLEVIFKYNLTKTKCKIMWLILKKKIGS